MEQLHGSDPIWFSAFQNSNPAPPEAVFFQVV
jgi:hypothetical protein